MSKPTCAKACRANHPAEDPTPRPPYYLVTKFLVGHSCKAITPDQISIRSRTPEKAISRDQISIRSRTPEKAISRDQISIWSRALEKLRFDLFPVSPWFQYFPSNGPSSQLIRTFLYGKVLCDTNLTRNCPAAFVARWTAFPGDDSCYAQSRIPSQLFVPVFPFRSSCSTSPLATDRTPTSCR